MTSPCIQAHILSTHFAVADTPLLGRCSKFPSHAWIVDKNLVCQQAAQVKKIM